MGEAAAGMGVAAVEVKTGMEQAVVEVRTGMENAGNKHHNALILSSLCVVAGALWALKSGK